MSAVSLGRIASGSPGAIAEAVEHVLALIGSPLDALRPGMRVLVKPNMFQLAPGFSSNVHVVSTVARLAAARGARVTVAERTRNIYQLLSETEVARHAEILSLDDAELRITHIESATSLRVPIAIPAPVLDCDYFIGVPQLRTHASVLLSNAMKNLIGLLPGYTTRIVHMTGVDESVVDLNVMRPHDLVVSDATTVVEGNYPMAGVLREVGLVGASTSAVAMDAVIARLSGFDPAGVVYLRHACQRGLGEIDLGRIDVRGLSLEDAAFDLHKAPTHIVPPRPGVHVYADTACEACQRYIAGALAMLGPELSEYEGELTIVAGPMTELPELRGAVVLVGNALYEHRDAGVYIEGCPPRAIQAAGFRYAMGSEVTADQRTQFRVPAEEWQHAAL